MERRCAYPPAIGGGILPRMSTTTPQPARKKPVPSPTGAQPPRIRAKLREALLLIANEGVTQKEAAERSGLHEATVCKALRKIHVQDALEAMKLEVIRHTQAQKEGYKALAMRHAFHLMKNANSEAVQARMVEFLAGEARAGTQVNVQINNDRGGYEFVRPGQRVVEIRGATDGASEGEGPQHPDDEGKA